jgi:phosphopantothenoylcysteine synthetase/decarboxylase
MNDAEATFGYDTNKVSIISEAHGKKDYALKQKKELARYIVQEVENFSAYQIN